jgi:glycerol-3-phosphate dehydrogenase (NAD(P)+)
MNITVLGAGAWGTALARLLHQNGHAVTLWAHDPRRLQEIQRTGRNERYLPGISLPADWRLEGRLQDAIENSDGLVMAVPSKAFRTVASHLCHFDRPIISVTKGIEFDTGLTMCGILKAAIPRAQPVAMSGPTLALEVARDIPTAIVAASEHPGAAQLAQEWFHRPAFRVYTSRDVPGAELGGALKNVIAIAAGVGDGLGYGDNTKATLITRALVEVRRLGVACGANPETFSGLSGLGDLTVTCFSRLSRNRAFGERLGRGEKLASILINTVTVAEGYPTACAAHQLARRVQVETPIIDEVYAMLYQGKDVAQTVRDLTSRESKPEAP